MGRARHIAGRTLGELARGVGMVPPPDLRRHKGWVGQLLEAALGSTAGSKKGPDFSALGVELKTIPVDLGGQPRESTFLTVLTPGELVSVDFERSAVMAKLRKVLWLPIQADPAIPLAARRIGNPHLWSPTPAEVERIRADWELFASWVADGQLDAISAHQGAALQVRPKARDAKSLRLSPDPEGGASMMLPRGFYLRASFTKEILARYYRLPSPP